MTKDQIIQRVCNIVNDYNMQSFEQCNDIENSWDPIEIEKDSFNSITLYTLGHKTFGLPLTLLRFISNQRLNLVFSSRLDYYKGTFEVKQCYPTAIISII